VSAPDSQQVNEPNVNIAVTAILLPSGQKWPALEFLVHNTRYTFALSPEAARSVAAQLPEEIENAARECSLHNAGIVHP